MVKKPLKQFVCQECGSAQAKWGGRCPVCGAWNSLVEEEVIKGPSGLSSGGQKLQTVKLESAQSLRQTRLDSGSGEFNRVLGGGLVAGSVVLVAGEPGIGKSTLLLGTAAAMAGKHRVLYVSGEESVEQLKLRATRLRLTAKGLDLAAATSADDVSASIMSRDYELVIVDSIQTMATRLISSGGGSISQVTASAQLLLAAAKQSNTAVILTGHVTKEGNIAGPRLLEHIVDVVIYLEGERFSNFKLLRGVKNRFGSTDEVGIFAMTAAGMSEVKNPSEAFLSERLKSDGSVVLATLEGSRALLVEVQALVAPSSFGYPKRTSAGYDVNRLNLLLAVLGRRAGLRLGAQDVYVNVVGGIRISEPAADLAVALAVASAARGKPLIDKTVVFGEVGLSGEIRSTPQADKRLAEAKKMGFIQSIAAPGSSTHVTKPATSLAQAIKSGLKP